MHLQSQPLSSEKQKLIDELFDHHGFDILLEVLESGRFELMATSAALRQYAPDEQAHEQAKIIEGQAREISSMITRLVAMKAQKEPFTTSTATPTE